MTLRHVQEMLNRTKAIIYDPVRSAINEIISDSTSSQFLSIFVHVHFGLGGVGMDKNWVAPPTLSYDTPLYT